MFSHRCQRPDQQEFWGFPPADELTYSPQSPTDQAAPQLAALGQSSSERADHGLSIGLAGVELRNRIKSISIQPQIVADHSQQMAGIVRPAWHAKIDFGDRTMP